MTDLIDTARRQLSARLVELRPLVEEAARVQQALDALDATGRPPPRVRTSNQRRGATVRGQTGQRIIEYVKANPGSTAGDVAKALGLKRNSTSTRLAQLAKVGELTKVKRGYAAPT
jgi:winged helix-turn-helix DNA-binding protein